VGGLGEKDCIPRPLEGENDQKRKADFLRRAESYKVTLTDGVKER